MKTTWHTPAGPVSRLYRNMLSQPHLLIAGATGSGKSVVINGMMYTALYNAPCDAEFILVDPKRVELVKYARLPHVVKYATEPDDMIAALDAALAITEKRYKAMAKERVTRYTGADLYIVIDELADLMTTNKKAAQPRLQRLAQIGRAARVHIIAATQCPLATVIPTAISVNFDARVALRTRNAQDSRNILQRTGCELLPRYGQGYYMTPEGIALWNIPMIPENDLSRMINYWTSPACRTRSLF